VSKKKTLALIHGEEIHFAPGTKVVSASTYTTLLSLKEMLQKAKEDAKRHILEAKEEAKKIKKEAEESGFEEGMKRWTDQLQQLEKEIDKVHEEIRKIAIPLALKAAKKIVGKEIELTPQVIVNIVSENLQTVKQHAFVKVYVNKKDYVVLEKEKEKLKALFESLKSFAILIKDDVEPGGCIIETEVGIINARIGNKWAVLEKAFEGMMKQEESLPPADENHKNPKSEPKSEPKSKEEER